MTRSPRKDQSASLRAALARKALLEWRLERNEASLRERVADLEAHREQVKSTKEEIEEICKKLELIQKDHNETR